MDIHSRTVEWKHFIEEIKPDSDSKVTIEAADDSKMLLMLLMTEG